MTAIIIISSVLLYIFMGCIVFNLVNGLFEFDSDDAMIGLIMASVFWPISLSIIIIAGIIFLLNKLASDLVTKFYNYLVNKYGKKH